ncbi:MAG TPA: HEPN domain-containing protein [Chloroflexota bacterium]|nr:HEPN domain-containing protein [Chloroflexota bacterium]
MRADTRNWVDSAEYDWVTARELLTAGRYVYVVFFCHLAIEKLLKAHVAEVTNSLPPRTHDLVSLIRTAGLDVPGRYLQFIGTISGQSVSVRFPDEIVHTVSEYPELVVREYLRQTEEVLQWLTQHPNLR